MTSETYDTTGLHAIPVASISLLMSRETPRVLQVAYGYPK